MEQELQSFVAMLTELWTMLVAQSRNLLLPSRLTQIAILLVCVAVSWGFARATLPRMRAWMRGLEGWPKWRLRFVLLVEKRLWLMYFILLAWLSVAGMRMITTFPSRRYILALVASIATAWLIVSLTTRLVRNPLLRRMVSWGLWVWVTLYFLGLTDEASDVLDGIAIQFGDFRLSALAILKAMVVTALLFTFARMLAGTTSARIRRNDDISPSMQVLLVKIVQIVLFSAAFFIGLKAVGFDLTGLAVLSGAVGVGLGFGLQKVVSNLVSGVIILLDKSVKPGDVISLGETFGWITALGARYVSITTRDGKEYLIPNEDLITGQVVNWSHQNEFVRLDIYFGTAYADDPHLVRKVAIEAAASVNRVLADRPPVCHIVGFGDSSVDYILRFWITDPTGGLTNIRGNVYLALWDAFKENGISIPFPQREVKVLEGSSLVTRPEAGTRPPDGGAVD
ncbi:MAG: mechanosensitive ion channel protein [Maritimibacter sp.]|nr:mechanosensitive ion channel protein [Maritimibacter sp.]